MSARKPSRAADRGSLMCRISLAALVALSGCAQQQAPKAEQRESQQPQQPGTVLPPAAVAKAPAPENVVDAKSPEVLPETHFAAGRLHESQNQFARAAEQYRQVIALSPKNLEAYNRLGIVLDRLGRFKEADEAFLQGLRVSPKQTHLRNNLAFSYIMQARWTEAETALKECIAQQPTFARAHVNLGLVLAQQNRFDEALAQFSKALPRADAYYNLGLMYQSKRKLPEAANAFKTALELNPQFAAAQKRLDALPEDVVKSARAISAVKPKPAPVVAKAEPKTLATTENAVVTASPAPAKPTTVEPTATPPAATQPVIESGLSATSAATQPAVAETPAIEPTPEFNATLEAEECDTPTPPPVDPTIAWMQESVEALPTTTSNREIDTPIDAVEAAPAMPSEHETRSVQPVITAESYNPLSAPDASDLVAGFLMELSRVTVKPATPEQPWIAEGAISHPSVLLDPEFANVSQPVYEGEARSTTQPAEIMGSPIGPDAGSPSEFVGPPAPSSTRLPR